MSAKIVLPDSVEKSVLSRLILNYNYIIMMLGNATTNTFNVAAVVALN